MTRPARLAAVGLLLGWIVAGAADAATRRVALGDGLVVALADEQEIFLETTPLEGEGLFAFSRRLTGSEDAAPTISTANGSPRRLLADVRYKVPLAVLRGDLKARVLRGLFPADIPRADGWLHTVPPDGGGHSLWRLAEWFTGRGQNFPSLRAANRFNDDTVPPGARLLIPADLLLPDLRVLLPPPPPPSTAANVPPASADEPGPPPVIVVMPPGGEPAPPSSVPPPVPPHSASPPAETAPPFGITYDAGNLIYRLRQGEALYSSVVVRFTGRTFANDVNALAADIAKLNGIRDVTDIPTGRPIKVPFDLLLPEFLPQSDPRRAEYDKNRAESSKYSNTVHTSTLEGITVILDAGHGGRDPGAMPGGVREGLYVYDIMVRVKHLLESRTAARIEPTVRDGAAFRIAEHDVLPLSTDHVVLTTPAYPITDAVVGTNLRWYLANSLHAKALKRSGDPRKTVFISLHADSLHSSLRGAMTYIPAASLTLGAYGKSESVYRKHAEVRENPRVDFSWKERVESEGLSRQLATRMLEGFRKHGLRIHNEKPIRDRIIRCRHCRPFVPAVVRRNAVPAKLLLEVCNLNNAEDRALLTTRAFRQKVAEAIVDGILAYYGESTETPIVAGP